MKIFYFENYKLSAYLWDTGMSPAYVREYFLLGILVHRKISKQPWSK